MFYLRLSLVIICALFLCLILTFVNILTFWSPNRFYRSIHIMAKVCLGIIGLRVQAEGAELLLNDPRPKILVGNHQSALDAFTFGSITPPGTVAIGKKELRWVPIIGQWLWSTGCVFLDRKNRDRAIDQMSGAVKAMKERGVTLGILPEGTRNLKGSGLLPFKKGAFHLAVKAQAPIYILVSSPLATIANFENRVFRPGIIHMKVFPAIETKGMTEENIEALMEEVRTKMLGALDTLKTEVL
jgi:1-acyl-sn-glycerol-3-phosphate acyltransferase